MSAIDSRQVSVWVEHGNSIGEETANTLRIVKWTERVADGKDFAKHCSCDG
jgi:hypothetical protein